MVEPDPRDERVWEPGWAGHAVAQRRRMARLSLAEKLEWLESAQRLVLHLRRGARPSGGAEPADSTW
ncbi:MAG: hypothetical protein E6K72_11370 [Candidatus Eisenbacteria bacterium]|uniref:Uncharacterized protein n=1 Tax=Eiseniibacteriota bacterium TaxID=2212470 RepID=A0A538SGM9_UNCEI|nr:MAG: hypothetical protein E6K72_11370 [Candidatus Eisenbacteria bacterium]